MALLLSADTHLDTFSPVWAFIGLPDSDTRRCLRGPRYIQCVSSSTGKEPFLHPQCPQKRVFRPKARRYQFYQRTSLRQRKVRLQRHLVPESFHSSRRFRPSIGQNLEAKKYQELRLLGHAQIDEKIAGRRKTRSEEHDRRSVLFDAVEDIYRGQRMQQRSCGQTFPGGRRYSFI